MGREIRRVIPNWQHPQKEYFNYQTGRRKKEYCPMRDKDVQTSFDQWMKEYQKWLADNHSEPYRSFCEDYGNPPNPEYYRPKWNEEDMTWFQVYETVSEGTPVTPPFATKEELIGYLCEYGDFWDQKRGSKPWTREQAERFVERGFAMSLIIDNTGKVKEPKEQ